MSLLRAGFLLGAAVSTALVAWHVLHREPPAAPPPSVAAALSAVERAIAPDPASGRAWVARFREQAPTRDSAFYGDFFTAPTAIADVRAVLTDTAPLLSLREGDIENELVPPAVAERADLLTLLDAVLLHPRVPPDVRAGAVETLAAVVATPSPQMPSSDGFILLVGEKASALASLARADRADAVRAYRAIPSERMSLLVRVETKRRLAGRGLSTVTVRRFLRELEQGA